MTDEARVAARWQRYQEAMIRQHHAEYNTAKLPPHEAAIELIDAEIECAERDIALLKAERTQLIHRKEKLNASRST